MIIKELNKILPINFMKNEKEHKMKFTKILNEPNF